MSSLRFLLSRRWLLFAITVTLLAAVAWRLGEWQFHRLAERETTNSIVAGNVEADPVPVGEVLALGTEVPDRQEWRRVSATGEYDVTNTVVVRYQTRDGQAGIDVVVPLRTEEGPVLLVDRGWMAAANRGADVPDIPPPPAGKVTVTGWVRADGTGDSTRVSDQSVRSISSTAIGEALGLEVYGGFIDLDTETPAPAEALTRTELPDLGSGPHFFYGLQWWFFGALAIFGFFYLLYDEWRGPDRAKGRPRSRARGRSAGPLQRAEHSSVDREHDTADKA